MHMQIKQISNSVRTRVSSAHRSIYAPNFYPLTQRTRPDTISSVRPPPTTRPVPFDSSPPLLPPYVLPSLDRCSGKAYRRPQVMENPTRYDLDPPATVAHETSWLFQPLLSRSRSIAVNYLDFNHTSTIKASKFQWFHKILRFDPSDLDRNGLCVRYKITSHCCVLHNHRSRFC